MGDALQEVPGKHVPVVPDAGSDADPPACWGIRFENYPMGLAGACFWLGAAYTLPWLLLEYGGFSGYLTEEGQTAVQLSILASLALLLLVYWRLVRKAPLAFLGISLRRWHRDLGFAAVFALGLALFYACVVAGVWLVSRWAADDPESYFRNFVQAAAFRSYSPFWLASIGAAYPVLEEFWFRGLLYAPLRGQFGKWTAIVGLAAIFALAHGQAFPINQFFGGLVFAWAYEKRGRLPAPILLHMLGNGGLALVGWFALRWL